jgi:hypothetical protein
MVIVSTLVVWGPMTLATSEQFADWRWHIARAFQLEAEQSFEGLPHFLYQVIVIGSSKLFPGLPADVQGGLPVLAFSIAFAVMLYWLLRKQFLEAGVVVNAAVPALLVIILTTLAPIFILGIDITYLFPTTYHSPT